MKSKRERPAAVRYLPASGVRVVASATGTAAAVIGDLAPGDHITGLTGGQFSSIDALEHICQALGGGDVCITTWTSGLYDATRAAGIKRRGLVRRLRMMCDRSTFEKSPQYAGALVAELGEENIRCMSIHSKVTIFDCVRGRAVWRSSANLNRNKRTEQFDVSVCDDVHRFYAAWFEALWVESGEAQDNGAIMRSVYGKYLERFAPIAGAPSFRLEPGLLKAVT